MHTDPVNQVFTRSSAAHARPAARAANARNMETPLRLSSIMRYMFTAGLIAGTIFFALWWLLQANGDETPWVPAGLVAGVVMLIAAAAREVLVRRASTQHLLEQDRHVSATGHTKKHSSSDGSGGGRNGTRIARFTSALRSLQQQSAQANTAANTSPEAHLELYHACKQFLAGVEDVFGSSNARGTGALNNSESRAVLRAGQERARALAKQHLLAWARAASRVLTHDAQRRVLLADKLETAARAFDVIESALKLYPDEPELKSSALAVQELIATIKVAHWVELAERAAFKGQFAKAIDRYQDALFYLSRGALKEESRSEAAERIKLEVEILHAHLRTSGTNTKSGARSGVQENV
ncbi:MAG: hypothetical protein ACR2LC_15465 [Pyrinomonadaceae bacterium]